MSRNVRPEADPSRAADHVRLQRWSRARRPVWLHLGTAGPRRIDQLPDGQSLLRRTGWSTNDPPGSNATDLVFIDPVGTGYSRPAEGEKGEQFYGVKEDIGWVSDFIRLYATLYQRWGSPKFLAARATARPGRRGCRSICWTATA